jgi:hypothetical protein
MMKEEAMKPISSRTHTIIGLIVGVALLLAPMLFGFSGEGGAPVAVPMYVGIFILLSELTTTSPASPFKIIPMRVHIILDVLTGLFLLLSPWLFGFADLKLNAWLPHVIVGVLTAGYALLTRTSDEQPAVV